MLVNLLFLALFGPSTSPVVQHELAIRITNIQNTSGKPLLIGVYAKSDAFPGENTSRYNKIILAKSSVATVTFKLPPGEYAVALMHDVNDDGKMEKNWIGYPTEPFGFSRNFKPKLGAPSFKDCSVDLRTGSQRIEIKLL